jgi:hypothetical protein
MEPGRSQEAGIIMEGWPYTASESTHSLDTVRYSRRRDGSADFSKSRPYSFAQVSVQKIREMDTKVVGRLFPAFLCFEYRLCTDPDMWKFPFLLGDQSWNF